MFAVVVATRAPLMPRHLFHFDSVNFALALEDFDPGLHQPQPPGYPLFVLLSRLLHLLVRRPEDVFFLAGALAATVAVLLLYKLGEEIDGRATGVVAALLLLFHPVLWFSGLTNQVRTYLAVVSCAVALAAFRALRPSAPVSDLYWVALTLGVLSGFRPTSLPLLIPLLILVGVRRRAAWQDWVLSGACMVAPVAVWGGATVIASGGAAKYLSLIREYADTQFAATSLLFGAPPDGALQMLESAVVYNFLGSIRWIWVILPLAVWRIWPSWQGLRLFLAAWFLPGFLFSSLVHVADPDQALLTIPALCLVGARLMTSLFQHGRKGYLAAAAAVAVAVGVVLFFHPMRGRARSVSYRVVQTVDREVSSTIAAISRHRQEQGLVILWHDGLVTWRQLSYYFPEKRLIVVEPSGAVWELSGTRRQEVQRAELDYLLPIGTKVAFILPPPGRGIRPSLRRSLGIREEGGVAFADPVPGSRFHLGGVSFVVPQTPTLKPAELIHF
ncbi:MAG: glycosyltransferase family 39 protein [Candidatus Solibacter usitatus]|nr:glycosyltransferase family 39 protein [Candidatus Solibacter usitatus]